MIGLSLSLCVRDIVEGRVELDDVEYIIAGTKISNENEFNEVCEDYKQYYWTHNPSVGKAIAEHLWNKKKILQPRLYNFEPPKIDKGIWRH